MTLAEYFARTDTPSAGSPVGFTMARILAKYPQISFNDARTEAQALVEKAARQKDYRGPIVFSEEQKQKERERLAKKFPRKAHKALGPQT